MIQYIRLFSILFTISSLVSCESESIDTPVENNSQLVSIQEFGVIGNSPTGALRTYIIDNNLNTYIDYEDDNYEIQSFTNGRMTSLEQYSNGVASGNITYSYDSSGRLINSSRSFSANSENTDITYEYVGNQILVTRTSFDNDDTILNEIDYVFTLNTNNQIIKLELLDSDFSWEATYAAGNLSTFTTFNGTNIKGSATFSYSVDVASIPYQKERYRFGNEWRNNIMLDQYGEYAFKQLAELGTNYLKGYTYTLTSNPSMSITLSVDYEFDNLGRLTKQTKDKMFFQTSLGRELTYQYE